ncbi:YPT1_3 [Blepharisma stoltei]|uniref:Uncharacterized protein n=1 Tax=Blepharisma stoltei TaxID=1481888 RepID=A0AAU9JRZ3_9CILI|nr:unnamed protein product [Blepharisma stoltei]
MENQSEYDYLFKILLIGDSEVGKSALLLRLCDDVYSENYTATIGVDFKIRTIQDSGKTVKLQLWDTAGQERFISITSNYYRGPHGIVIIYDITNRESFNHVNNWLQQIELYSEPNVKKFLIGNKSDLEERRVVTYEEGKNFAKSKGMNFIEVSARTSNNVEDAFIFFSREIKEEIAAKMIIGANSKANKLGYGEAIVTESKSKCCS